MRESVIYQEILEEGLGRGQVALAMVMRLLQRRVGAVKPDQASLIRGLTTQTLEDLAEALLDFSATADLDAWLQARQD